MSSNHSCVPEDDFFRALDKSLTMEYSSQKMSHFLSDLLLAINNLDDDPEDAFILYDEGNDDSIIGKFFTFQSSASDDTSQRYLHANRSRIHVTSKRKAHEISVDMFDDVQPQKILRKNDVNMQREAIDISVDMFDDDDDDLSCKNEMKLKSEKEEDAMSVDLFDDELPQRPECSVPANQNSADLSVDMFAEFEELSDHCSDTINIHEKCNIVDFANEKNGLNMDAPITDLTMMKEGEMNQVSRPHSIEIPLNNETSSLSRDVEEHLPTDDHQKIDFHRFPALNVNVESEDLEQSFDTVVCVPSIISDCEPSENEKTLSVEFEARQYAGQPTKENVSQKSENVIIPEIQLPVHKSANVSMQSSRQSLFLGFSGSDVASICEEFSSNFVPALRRSSSESSNFHGFSHITDPLASIGQRTSPHNAMLCTSRSEGSLNSTYCEEFEVARSMVTHMNATQFNFDEAYSQCFPEFDIQVSPNADRRQSFIEEIEKLILKIQNDLVCGRTLAIEVPYTLSWNNCGIFNERMRLNLLDKTRVIKTKPRIAIVVYLLSFIYKLLVNNETCTKREIYYSDPAITQSQLRVDYAVMDICFILNARPWELGIFSSSKGLIAGPIRITLQDDTIIDVGCNYRGILLPHQTMSIKKVETTAKFVLLVEKHTIYEKLLLEDVLNRLGPCILVTGKGYPDINTRAVLKKIWDDCQCPIYALVDADPYGIEIMLMYRHGSMKSSFYNDELAIPSIRWIGVLPSELKKFKLLSVPLAERDVVRLNNMVKRPYLSKQTYKELLILQKTLKKAEVEALQSNDRIVDWIDSYLSNKIQSGGLI